MNFERSSSIKRSAYAQILGKVQGHRQPRARSRIARDFVQVGRTMRSSPSKDRRLSLKQR